MEPTKLSGIEPIRHWQQAVGRGGDMGDIETNLINEILKQKDFKSAILLANRVIEDKTTPPLTKEKAHYLLGLLFLNGTWKVEKDVPKALEHFEHGPAAALYDLGVIHLKGLYGTPKDVDKGIDYLIRASDQGLKKASLTLGYINYLIEVGQFQEEKINETAITRFLLDGPDLLKEYDDQTIRNRINLAKKSDQPELYLKYADLAWQHWIKEGKKFSKEIAKRAWDDAQKIPEKSPKETKAKLKEAQTKLGMLKYVEGKVPYYSYNYHKAVEYWKKAATEPDPDPAALYYLGLAYSSGKGVGKDLKVGKQYLGKAARLGFKQSNVMLDHLEKKRPVSKKEIKAEQNELGLKRSPEIDVIKSNRPLSKKIYSWFKKHQKAIIGGIAIAIVSIIALAAIAAALVALTIFFPHVMIPIWIGVGLLGLGAISLIALFLNALTIKERHH